MRPGGGRRRDALRRLAALLATALVGACVSIPPAPRALVLQADGAVAAAELACAPDSPPGAPKDARGPAGALDPLALRVAAWNVHKEADPGWDDDLARLAAANDVLLLQEVELTPAVRRVVEGAGMRWVMASSWLGGDLDQGVLTAARAAPLATCTQRVAEPLLRLPKSALVSWFALEGIADTLAVVNVHAVNFTLTLDAYREQLGMLARQLHAHRGPIVFAGDFNTWNEARATALEETAAALGLAAVAFGDDRRTVFLGRQVDHIYVRGLAVLGAAAIEVTSSDHNPLTAVLRVVPGKGAPSP